MANLLDIEIVKWGDFNPKRDQKTYTWLRLSNDISTDPKLYELDAEQKFCWIEILCQASKKNEGRLKINLDQIAHITGVKRAKVDALVEFLVAVEIILVHDRALPRNSESTTPTYERTNERTNEDLAFSPKDLFALWNAGRGALPEAEKLTEKRKTLARNQIKLYPEPDHWALAIKKFSESKFCVDTWRPGFDDLLTESTRIKAIEGKYDERAKMSVVSSDQAWENSAGLVVSALKKYANWLESEHDVQALLGNELFTLARKANTTELRKIPAGPFHIQNIIKRLQDAQERAG